MKQRAVQNKRYYHGDFRSATTAPEVDTRARNYDLFVQHKTPVIMTCRTHPYFIGWAWASHT